jgi:hypothetical protein
MPTNTSETQLPTIEAGFDLKDAVGPPLRAGLAAVRDEAPVWVFFAYVCSLLNTELTNLVPARPDFASTTVFPMAVFVLFTTVRALRAPEVQFPKLALTVPVGLALVLPALNVLWHRPSPLPTETLRTVYELSNFAWAAVLIRFFWKRQPSSLLYFFGVGLVYGAVLENGGIVLGFFDEQNLRVSMVKPFVAPVATMIGWCVVLGVATYLVWRLREWIPTLKRQHFVSGLLVGVFATMLDMKIDPIATATGCWVWHSSLPPWFHGVPLVNFVAWLCALVPFAWVMFRVQHAVGVKDLGPWSGKQLGTALLFVPYALVIALIAFMTSTLLLEGPTGPSWTLLAEFTSKTFGLAR